MNIFLLSSFILFLELALIRWLPANVCSMAFFSNLVVMASFFGVGIGFLGEKIGRSWIRTWPLLFLIFLFLVMALRDFNVLIPSESKEWIWNQYSDGKISALPAQIPLEVVLTGIFFLVALLFFPLGQQLSGYLRSCPALHFYQMDLLGSLFGILLFSALSASSFPPWVWFAVGLLLLLKIIWPHWQNKFLLLVFVSLIPFTLGWFGRQEIWSPYYSILTQPKKEGFRVFVNRFFFQEAVDFSTEPVLKKIFSFPYKFAQKEKVLVIGAGSGNDVAVALANGAGAVDAVEIDPLILKLGDQHPQKPYRDPRVRTFVQDARTFLQTTKETYDLIVFGTLDSQALLSGKTTLRLDNYVYTLESIEAARRHLKKDGLLALYFSAARPWIWDHLEQITLRNFPGGEVRCIPVSCSLLNLMILCKAEGSFPASLDVYKSNPVLKPNGVPCDDWPFLYLAEPGIPSHYLKVIGAILLLGSLLVIFLLPPGNKIPHPNFFVLGVAFFLLETGALTRFSLLFGSTWVVNAVVFFGILTMVFLSNQWVRKKKISLKWVYPLLGASVLVCFFLEPHLFLYSSFEMKALVSALIVGLPVFFAGMIFSSLFEKTDNPAQAFGSNILGAFCGGFLEYLCLGIGFQKLILGIFLLYGISFLLSLRRRMVF